MNAAPNLAQPSNMTVTEGATANQAISATDPDGNPVTFSKTSGPTFEAVTTTSPGTGTATGNIALTPGFSDSGTYSSTVTATDNGSPPLSNSRSFTITVINQNRAPTLNAIANMSVAQGATA
ncbi:MAG: cadherin repeat domain-containing protein, partial [Candidatus Eisenbacteria bacterium]